jgi:hypothetical protein
MDKVQAQGVTMEVGFFHSAADDVVVTLKDGRIVHISPEFEAINVFANRAQFDDFHVGRLVSYDLPTF